jgi:hypothetical protein
MTTTPPPPPGDTIDLGRAFTFVPQDPDWIKKVLIGGVFTLLASLVVGVFFIAGYWVRLLRRTVAGEARPMPDWDDLGGLFGDGLKLVGVWFVHVLAVAVLVGGVGCLVGGLLFAVSAGMRGGSGDASGAAETGLAMAALVLYPLGIVLMLALSVYMPAAFVRVALLDRFDAGFDWRANLAFIRRQPANYALSLVVYLVASFGAQFGVVLCCVGVFPAVFWSYCILGYALGETARLDRQPVA